MPNNKIIDLERLSRFKDKLDNVLETKANVDGNYPTMTVGSADNLTPYGENSGVEESTPFVFQSAGGSSDIGSQAQLRALRGNSVAFNQGLTVNIPNWVEKAGLTLTIDTTNNTFTLNGTTTSSLVNSGWGMGTGIKGHTYLYKLKLVSGSVDYSNRTTQNTRHGYVLQPRIGGYSYMIDMPTSAKQEISQIRTQTESAAQLISASFDTGVVFTNAVFQWQIFDLTLLGKVYADVVSFNRDYPKPYYPYNAGTLLSSKSNGYKTVGYNAFDGEIEGGYIDESGLNQQSNHSCRTKNYIKVIAGQTYTISSSLEPNNIELREYDDNKNIISFKNVNTGTFSITRRTHYVRFYMQKSGSGWGTNPPTQDTAKIAFHLTWDESRTGYEPYNSETYPLPNVELRSAGNVYDELKPDGTLIRRIGVVDLGTLTPWDVDSTNGVAQYRSLLPIPKPEYGNKANIMCSIYERQSMYAVDNRTRDKIIAIGNEYQNPKIYDTRFIGKTAQEIKALLSGVYLFYELATPTIEQTEYTFAETTPIDDYGTQEFLYDSDIDIPVPQGNDFFYPVDYKAFIDSLGGRDDIEYAADQVVSQTQLTQALSTFLSSIQGYDATKTQTLKNVSGVIQWVDD